MAGATGDDTGYARQEHVHVSEEVGKSGETGAEDAGDAEEKIGQINSRDGAIHHQDEGNGSQVRADRVQISHQHASRMGGGKRKEMA